MFRADFYRLTMAVGVGVDENGLRMGAGNEFVEISVIEGRCETVVFGVAVEEGFVGFGDGDEFDVVAILDVGRGSGRPWRRGGVFRQRRRFGIGHESRRVRMPVSERVLGP